MRWLGVILFGSSLAWAGREEAHVAFAYGMMQRFRGDEKAHWHSLETALENDPFAVDLIERVAAKKWAEGKTGAAQNLFRRAIRERRSDPQVLLAYADFLKLRAGRDPAAIQQTKDLLRSALVFLPGDPDVVAKIFEVSSQTGHERRAVLSLLIRQDASSAMLFTALSRRLPDSDGLLKAEAAKRLRMAAEKHPEDPVLARAASEFFRRANQLPQAMEILDRHVAAAPWSLDLRVRLGVFHFAAGNDELAVGILRDVLAIDPGKAVAHQALAKYFRGKGDELAAVRHESEKIKLRGGEPGEFQALAERWLELGQAAEARLLLEKAVFEHPENFVLRLGLAKASRRDPAAQRRAAGIFREAEAILKEQGGRATAQYCVEAAEAAISADDFPAAEDHLRSAIRAFAPTEKKEIVAALHRLAELWEKQNRHLPAAAALRKRAAELEKSAR